MIEAAWTFDGGMMTTDEPIQVELELWFANQDGLVDLLRIPDVRSARYLAASSDGIPERSRKQHALTEILERRLEDDAPPELQRVLLDRAPVPGELVSVEQSFYFKSVDERTRVRVHNAVNTDKSTWRIEGFVHTERFPFASSWDFLSGCKSVFMLGTVIAVDDGLVSVRPLFIGQRKFGKRREGTFEAIDRRVQADQIGQFQEIDLMTPSTAAQLKLLKEIPEAEIKQRLAKIIGEPFVPKDWGGERSDLSTNNLVVDGKMTSAAFLLKGPGRKGATMQPVDLGKNGDQIERLSTEPAELLVVQYHSAISAGVVKTVAAFANDMRNPRRYMILDGDTTCRILRDYGQLT